MQLGEHMDLVCNPEFLFYRTEMSLLATKDTVRLLPRKILSLDGFPQSKERNLFNT